MEFTSIKIEQGTPTPKVIRYMADRFDVEEVLNRVASFELHYQQAISEIYEICKKKQDVDVLRKSPELFVEVIFVRQFGNERLAQINRKSIS